MTFLNEMFKNNNHIIFDIQHLSLEEKRKEIEKYNPFLYVFGYKLNPLVDYIEAQEK